jgi:hypothetical protein
MRMRVELAHSWRAKNRINGISAIGFLDGQVNPVGFAVTQSRLTEEGVPEYHFGVLIVRELRNWT